MIHSSARQRGRDWQGRYEYEGHSEVVRREKRLRSSHGITEDVFVHHSAILNDGYSLQENDEVEFEIEQGKKGPQAVRVVLVSEGKRA